MEKTKHTAVYTAVFLAFSNDTVGSQSVEELLLSIGCQKPDISDELSVSLPVIVCFNQSLRTRKNKAN